MKKTWILLLIFFSAGILSYADAQSVKNLNTKEFKTQIWDFEKNKELAYTFVNALRREPYDKQKEI